MHTTLRKHGSALFVALTLAAGPAFGAAVTFTPIADDTGEIEDFVFVNKSVALNDLGQVAFSALVRSQPRGTIFVGDGDTLTALRTGGGLVSINNAGMVVNGAWPSINDAGQVAEMVEGDIYRRPAGGGAPTLIASQVYGVTFLGGPAIDAAGRVAYAEAIVAQGSVWRRWYRSDGGAPVLIADSSGPIDGSGIAGYPAIDLWGRVYFPTRMDDGGFAIFAGDGTSLRTIVDSSGIFATFREISVDWSGTVAFWSSLDDGTEGLFVGADGRFDRVIADGDPLFGSVVTGLSFFQEGLNDVRQLAFGYRLQDGRTGIARADLGLVPEPGSMALGAAALAAAALARRRRSISPVAAA